MGEGAHVARALHIVLAAQGIDPHTAPPDVACQHRQIGHAHDHGRALAVFGNAKAIINRCIAACGIKPGRTPNGFRLNTRDGSQHFR